ncbi:lipoprotein [Streptomyces zinciresistens K42]|uniref:Lipoprotein n=1 Tax=Streptomyces zinciresistens K42 TaxID=700597 RepID=G2GKV9_9ACTN|nr:DUF4232 domain-containing protein [Streptomyces zinciresistens]EGX55853.1 lipoprotein [Streptomyces zinciresistens K42]
MPRALHAVSAVLTGVLLLAACGAPRDEAATARAASGAGGAGTEVPCPDILPRYGSEPLPAEQTVTGTPSPLPLSSSGADEDGVRLTGLYAWPRGSGCTAPYSAGFEVTNRTRSTAVTTVTIGFTSASGTRADTAERTLAPLAPGRTAESAVAAGVSAPGGPGVTGAEVVKVRSVPAAEAPSASGPCPASGVRLYADQGDAAMGLRVVGLRLANCGTRPYRVEGSPRVEVLGEDHERVDGVRVLDGTGPIGPVGGSGSPRPLVLRPGEAASATLAWRNTTEAGLEAVNAPYARVWARPGAAPVVVTPEFDLGTTGRLGVGPWQRADSRGGAGTATRRP